VIKASSDSAFRGDKTLNNPEELFLASFSSCHMLWYLHLCADAGIIVVAYTDNAAGTMAETEDGGDHFTEVNLFPKVVVTQKWMIEPANALHFKANKLCYFANSCNFEVKHLPECVVKRPTFT